MPAYAALRERARPEAARALAGAVLGLLCLGAGFLAVIGIAFAPAVTTVLVPGFDEPTRRLTITLVRILFPMSGLMVLSAWCLGVLNTHGRFFLPYAAPALWNVAGVAALVGAAAWLVSPDLPADARMHRLALALAWGTVAGSVLQVGVQIPACWRLLEGLALRVTTAVEGVREVLVAWTPLVVGAGVAQLSGLVDTFLGSLWGSGGVASLSYAQLVQVLPISLFGVSVAAVSLPALARDAARETPHEALRARLAAGFRRVAYFVVPSAFACAALGDRLVGALFQTGRFAAADTALVGGVLAAYGIGIPWQASIKLLASGFYAVRDTRTPVRVAVLSLVVSAGLGALLMRRYGPAGIALGSSLGAALNFFLLLGGLNRRVGPVLGAPAWRPLAVSAGSALAAALASLAAPRLAPGAGVVALAALALSIFGVAYLGLTSALRHPDAESLWTFLRRSRAS